MRLSLSHPRSPNAVYLLLNNLLQQEQPGRQNLGRVSAPPRSSERARETKAFQHNREKVFIPLLPFLREAGLGSFWNFPRDARLCPQKAGVLWGVCGQRVLQHLSLGQGQACGCTRIYPSEKRRTQKSHPHQHPTAGIPTSSHQQGLSRGCIGTKVALQGQECHFPYGNSCERDLYIHGTHGGGSWNPTATLSQEGDAFWAAASEALITSLVPQIQPGTAREQVMGLRICLRAAALKPDCFQSSPVTAG